MYVKSLDQRNSYMFLKSNIYSFVYFLQCFSSVQSLGRVWLFSTPWITACQASVSSSFRIDWLDLLSIQGTLKSLLQHYSSKASILQCLAFFIVQRSYPYMITGKTIALTRRTFVGKVMSLPPVFIYLENIHRFILLYKNS